MDTDRIHRATSADGTLISGRVHGQGPPLVLVPGGPADGETGWPGLLPLLTGRFTCFTLNTRGRGLSGDHPDHSRERIVEDVVAFVESIVEPVLLFGHSAGGTHALEAAAHSSAVGALALYEPTLMELADEEGSAHFSRALARVRQAVDDGRPGEGAQIFLEDLALANADELAVLAEEDAAQGMAPLVPVVLREVARSGPPRLTDVRMVEHVTMPVLLLHGSRTHPFYTGVVAHLSGRLSQCQVRTLPGLGHLGPEIQPGPVAAELVALQQSAPAGRS